MARLGGSLWSKTGEIGENLSNAGIVPEPDSPLSPDAAAEAKDVFHAGGSIASPRKQSVVAAVNDFLTSYQFDNPKWLILPIVASWSMIPLCVFLAYAQGLEAKPIASELMTGDLEEAQNQIFSPDTYTPCFSVIHDSCTSQYAASFFFLACSLAAAFLGGVLTWRYNKIQAGNIELERRIAEIKKKQQEIKAEEKKEERERSRRFHLDTSGSGSVRSVMVEQNLRNGSRNNTNNSEASVKKGGSFYGTEQSNDSSGRHSDLVTPVPADSGQSEMVTIQQSASTLGSAVQKIRSQASDLSGSVRSTLHQVNFKDLKSTSTMVGDAATKGYTFIKLFRPGNAYFWHRALVSMVFEISMQLIRGFLLYDSYARVSAAQTIAQSALMVVHIDVFVYMWWLQSEVGYVLINFYSEVAYLAVRLSLHGPLSMRCTSALDFMTLALPLMLSMTEIMHIFDFILLSKQRAKTKKKKKSAWIKTAGVKKIFMFLLAVVCTGLGAAVIYTTIQKYYIEGCEVSVVQQSLDETGGAMGGLLPPGVFCLAWQFDLYLNPGCSCLYINFKPVYGTKCAGFGEDEHASLAKVKPHLAAVRFAYVGVQSADRCRLTEKDAAMIASWEHLSVLNMYGWPYKTIPDSWSGLIELKTVQLYYSRIEKIDAEKIRQFPRLEKFLCMGCPHLENFDALTLSNVPRLETVAVFGSKTCSDAVGLALHPEEYKCVPMGEERHCATLEEFQLQMYVYMIQPIFRTECFETSCHAQFVNFDLEDTDGNGVQGPSELRWQLFLMGREMNYEYETLDDAGAACLVSKLRQTQRFPQDFATYEPGDGLTMAEYFAFFTEYSTCTECRWYPEEFEKRHATHVESKRLELDANANPCDTARAKGLAVDDWEGICSGGVDICTTTCDLAMQILLGSDVNGDREMSADEFEMGLDLIGLVHLKVPNLWSCVAEAAPTCLEATEGRNTLPLWNTIRLGMSVANLNPSSCEKCANYPFCRAACEDDPSVCCDLDKNGTSFGFNTR